ncbi:hypothetical protein U1839_08475 [Sphingomonas sp. RT2P30]|uniref:hypothetical protein n=1 Tax=Parasphingomonas halimpatiens TaxID=3096162 RepID=UPI002FC8FBF4
MLILATFDLANADRALFDSYEAKVLPLLARHGARIEWRVRAADRSSETHLLHFPDAISLASYRADPDRLAASGDWENCGATSVQIEVESLGI